MQDRSSHGDHNPKEQKRDYNTHESSAFHGSASMVMDESRSGQWRI